MVKVFVPDVISVLILEAVGTVSAPDKVAADEVLNNLIAPLTPLYPKPFIVITSGIVSAVAALISMAAPDPTVVVDCPAPPADTLPNASALEI